MTLTLFNLF